AVVDVDVARDRVVVADGHGVLREGPHRCPGPDGAHGREPDHPGGVPQVVAHPCRATLQPPAAGVTEVEPSDVMPHPEPLLLEGPGHGTHPGAGTELRGDLEDDHASTGLASRRGLASVDVRSKARCSPPRQTPMSMNGTETDTL